MKDFKISKEYFEIDGKQEPFLCGEIHYFRMDKALWEPALDKLIQAGANAVAYYVPWFVHEYEENKFDFKGTVHPDNNLHEWIKLTIKKGLICILRPGPYVYAETTNLGIPVWFTDKYPNSHPQVYKNGKYEDYGFKYYASHNNKDFLQCTQRWLSAVMQEVNQYLAPIGNVWMIQLCNEIPGDDNMDENPVNIGTGDENGIFPRYLKNEYKTVDALNEAYNTRFANLYNIEPYQLCEANKNLYKTEKLRYYYAFYYPEYFQKLREMLGVLPKEITLLHNAYNPKAISLHYHNKKQNPWLNIGVDCYYSIFGNLTLKNGSYFCEYGAEYAKAMIDNPPWVVEQECGYWNDYPQVFGPEIYIWNIWTIAAGYKGINMYLFAAGKNRAGMGFFGTDHNWLAPVTKSGEKFHTYNDIKRSLTDIKANFKILGAENRYDITLGVKQSYGMIWRNLANNTRESYFALRTAGFTPLIIDFEAISLNELCKHNTLCIATDRYLDEIIQQKLADYIKFGNKLVVFGCIPYLTQTEKQCTILADYLDVNISECIDAQAEQTKIIQSGEEVFAGRTLQSIVEKSEQPKQYPMKAQIFKTEKDNGIAVVLPCAVDVIFESMPRLIGEILASIGNMPYIKGAKTLRAIPKSTGNTVLINFAPVKICESITVGNITSKYDMEPFSFKII